MWTHKQKGDESRKNKSIERGQTKKEMKRTKKANRLIEDKEKGDEK